VFGRSWSAGSAWIVDVHSRHKCIGSLNNEFFILLDVWVEVGWIWLRMVD
jgi:hypothetical protein